MDEDEDFSSVLDEDVNDTVTEAPAAVEEATAPAEPAQPELVEEPAPETPAEPKPEPGYVPISAIMDERDKRQAAERELARIRAAQVQQVAPAPVPDVFDDPQGFIQHQEMGRYQDRLYFSEQLATVKHGAETVQAAKEWGIEKCASDPLFNQKLLSSQDPVGMAVQEYQREQIASQVSPDAFKEFQAWKAAQASLATQTPAASAAPTTRVIPPRSLASAPSAGGISTEVEQTDEEVFNDTFTRK